MTGAGGKPTVGYVCEHCGYEGRVTGPVDQAQCPACGKQVTPLPRR
jgi:DNA-directed RNA polymerase subunit RPC12/RpoP